MVTSLAIFHAQFFEARASDATQIEGVHRWDGMQHRTGPGKHSSCVDLVGDSTVVKHHGYSTIIYMG